MQTQMVILLLAAARLMPDPQNPRKAADGEDLRLDLRLLGQDMKQRGVLVPLLVRRNGDVYVIIDGHRRLAAALLVGIDKLPCIVVEGNVTPEQSLEIALITSLHKQDLSAPEKVHAYLALKRLRAGSTAKELAARLSVDPSLASIYQSYENCIPDVQKAFDEGKIVLKAMNAISRQPQETQGEILQMALAGMSGAELVRRTRKMRADGSSKGSEVRVDRIKIELESGMAVTFAKKGLTLDDAIEAAPEAVKVMKKGRDEGLTAKTISRASAERAKANY